jgi:hypothetical protein
MAQVAFVHLSVNVPSLRRRPGSETLARNSTRRSFMNSQFSLFLSLTLVLALSLPSFAAFHEDFQDDTAGTAPTPTSSPFGNPGWASFGGITVQSEGANLFLRETNNTAAFLFGQPEAAGRMTFDIRFNQGVNSPLYVDIRAYPYSPIRLEWFHDQNNTNTPLSFRSVGDSQYIVMTNDFPIGSWQTVAVDFTSTGGGLPRGTYWVGWNGITNDYQYLDQGVNGLAIDSFVISAGGTTTITDIDNIILIPEPGTLAWIVVSASLIWHRRR